MIYEKQEYLAFSGDAQRLAANLEQAYRFWLDARQSLQKLPASMYWAERPGQQYLYVKQSGTNNGTSLGARSSETEQQFVSFTEEKKQAVERVASADALIQTRSGSVPPYADAHPARQTGRNSAQARHRKLARY